MLSGRSVYTLTLPERLALRSKWRQSGQCPQCFHTSISRRAENNGGGQPTQHNAPRRGPTRQQRAAMISEEVKMIQRDHPSPTFREPDPETLRPAGAGQTVDPEVLGEGVTPGRMGQNDTPTREGPTAQSVGRVASEKAVSDTSKMARGVRSPDDVVKEPAESAQNVSAVTSGDAHAAAVNPFTEGDETDVSAISAANSNPVVRSFWQDLKHGNYSTSTIAGGRFENVIAEQVDQATRKAGPLTRRSRLRPQPPSYAVRQQVVAGRFKRPEFDQATLNDIAKTTSMNGTYMRKDTVQFLRKVQSLLPASHGQHNEQR